MECWEGALSVYVFVFLSLDIVLLQKAACKVSDLFRFSHCKFSKVLESMGVENFVWSKRPACAALGWFRQYKLASINRVLKYCMYS